MRLSITQYSSLSIRRRRYQAAPISPKIPPKFFHKKTLQLVKKMLLHRHAIH